MKSFRRRLPVLFAVFIVLPAIVLSQTPPQKAVDISPGFVRFQLLRGESGTQSVTLYSNESAPLEVVDVTSPVKWITIKFHKAEAAERIEKGQPGNAQYRFDISLDGGAAEVGPIAERIKIKTNSAASPEVPLGVSGAVRP